MKQRKGYSIFVNALKRKFLPLLMIVLVVCIWKGVSYTSEKNNTVKVNETQVYLQDELSKKYNEGDDIKKDFGNATFCVSQNEDTKNKMLVCPKLIASGNTIVYITESGKKYHRGNCRYLYHSKFKIKLKDAKRRGYKPCKICKPPTK